MNTITQIYDEHASMPPHGETKKESENLINYLLHDGAFTICFVCRISAILFFLRVYSLINSSSHRRHYFVFVKNQRGKSSSYRLFRIPIY